jgi:predicted N-acetyltransferase YhbS
MTSTAAARAAWTVRPGRPEDTASILELFQATFGKPLSEAAYRWKFFESPWRIAAPTTFVAAVGDRIVGHLGGTPLRFRLGGGEVRAVHIGDSMVAEDFRRQGIMTAIGLASKRAWAAGGAALVLALPTQNWVGLRRRLDYRATFRLGWLWRPLRLGSLVPRRHAGRGLEVSGVETPGPEFDTLWEAVNGRCEALVVRNRAWVAYRYASAPGFGYRILLARAGKRPAGYLVYRVMTDGGRRNAWIADLFTAPDDRGARAALVRAACAELRRAGAVDVRIFAAPGTALARDLRRAGFLPRRGEYDVRVGPLVPDLPWDLLRDPGRFFLMGGDFDVV